MLNCKNENRRNWKGFLPSALLMFMFLLIFQPLIAKQDSMGTDSEIRILVRNHKSEPMAGARIKLYDLEKKKLFSGTSEKTGLRIPNLATGELWLKVSKVGYESQKIRLSLRNHSTNFTVVLGRPGSAYYHALSPQTPEGVKYPYHKVKGLVLVRKKAEKPKPKLLPQKGDGFVVIQGAKGLDSDFDFSSDLIETTGDIRVGKYLPNWMTSKMSSEETIASFNASLVMKSIGAKLGHSKTSDWAKLRKHHEKNRILPLTSVTKDGVVAIDLTLTGRVKQGTNYNTLKSTIEKIGFTLEYPSEQTSNFDGNVRLVGAPEWGFEITQGAKKLMESGIFAELTHSFVSGVRYNDNLGL